MNLCGRHSVLARLALFEKEPLLVQNINKKHHFWSQNVTNSCRKRDTKTAWILGWAFMPFGSILAPFWGSKVVRGRSGKSPRMGPWGLWGACLGRLGVIWVPVCSKSDIFIFFLLILASFFCKKQQFLQVVLWNDQPSKKNPPDPDRCSSLLCLGRECPASRGGMGEAY